MTLAFFASFNILVGIFKYCWPPICVVEYLACDGLGTITSAPYTIMCLLNDGDHVMIDYSWVENVFIALSI